MRIFICLSFLLLLTGCVSQDQADVKMAKGCAAAVNSLIEDDGKTINEIKSTNYSSEEAEGGLHRRVTIDAIEKDGWLELDQTYSCLFMQEWGLFKSFHRALLVQVKVNDELYGKKDGTIIGSFDDFMKIIRVTDGAMGQ